MQHKYSPMIGALHICRLYTKSGALLPRLRLTRPRIQNHTTNIREDTHIFPLLSVSSQLPSPSLCLFIRNYIRNHEPNERLEREGVEWEGGRETARNGGRKRERERERERGREAKATMSVLPEILVA